MQMYNSTKINFNPCTGEPLLTCIPADIYGGGVDCFRINCSFAHKIADWEYHPFSGEKRTVEQIRNDPFMLLEFPLGSFIMSETKRKNSTMHFMLRDFVKNNLNKLLNSFAANNAVFSAGKK